MAKKKARVIKRVLAKYPDKQPRVVSLTYERLVSTGQYENVRVGGTVEVKEADPNLVFKKFAAWVDKKAEDLADGDIDDECDASYLDFDYYD